MSVLHQYDDLSENHFQCFHLLIFAMEVRLALSCLEDTHRSLLTQYLADELEKTKGNEFSEKRNLENQSRIQPLEEATLLSVLYNSRQVNISNLLSLFSSGVIVSSPTLPTPPSSQSSPPLTPVMYQTLSQLLSVINLFHTLLSINWVISKRTTKHIIRWRKSFAGAIESPTALHATEDATAASSGGVDPQNETVPS